MKEICQGMQMIKIEQGLKRIAIQKFVIIYNYLSPLPYSSTVTKKENTLPHAMLFIQRFILQEISKTKETKVCKMEAHGSHDQLLGMLGVNGVLTF